MNDNKSIGDSPSSSLLLIERQEAESVRMRHMGVLGLCAFISAYPYDIPDFVPDVFEHLGAHLNDPQPIPVCYIYFRKICFFNKMLLIFCSQPFEKLLATLSAPITKIGQRIN